MEKLISLKNPNGYHNISDDLGYILILPPSTGSKTAIKIFKNFPFSTYELKNNQIRFVKEGVTHVHNPFLFDGHEKYGLIMTCRNPYSRWVSSFKRNLINMRFIKSSIDLKEQFHEFILNNVFSQENFKEHMQVELEFSKIAKKVDYFLRIENLLEDYKSIPFIEESEFFRNGHLEKVLSTPIGHHMSDSSLMLNLFDDWQDYYSEESANVLYRILETEFIFYGYDKSSWKKN